MKTGNTAGLAICEALGIPTRGVRAVRIEAEAGKNAVVVIERNVTDEEGQRVSEVLTLYRVQQG